MFSYVAAKASKYSALSSVVRDQPGKDIEQIRAELPILSSPRALNQAHAPHTAHRARTKGESREIRRAQEKLYRNIPVSRIYFRTKADQMGASDEHR